jgi:hypothetical protein
VKSITRIGTSGQTVIPATLEIPSRIPTLPRPRRRLGVWEQYQRSSHNLNSRSQLRKRLVTDIPGPMCNGCSGTLTRQPAAEMPYRTDRRHAVHHGGEQSTSSSACGIEDAFIPAKASQPGPLPSPASQRQPLQMHHSPPTLDSREVEFRDISAPLPAPRQRFVCEGRVLSPFTAYT